MRAAAILAMGCSPKSLNPFQTDTNIDWQIGLPASAHDADIILLFGGDGTLHRHLNQLVRLGLPLLIVPAGSGNDFARALGLRHVRDSIAAWKEFCGGVENVREIDLGTITPLDPKEPAPGSESIHHTHFFGCVAGLGLDAEVARRANQLPRWLRGHGGYALTLMPTIFRFAPFPMKILEPAEDRAIGPHLPENPTWTLRSDQPTMLAAFANAPLYGGGMQIAPHARMDDGLLDVCVVGPVNPFRLFCLFPTVYAGHHLSIREVEYFQRQRIRVETEHPLDVYADGEFVCRTPVEIGLQRSILRVISPQQANSKPQNLA